MIPPYQSDGFLPPGIFWADGTSEIADRFGHNAHRAWLLEGFLVGVYLLRKAGCRTIFLDGSFVSMKEFPTDFDACWDTTGVDFFFLDPVFAEFSNLRAAQRMRFRGEFFPTKALAEAPWTNYLDFFQTNKANGDRKGIVGLNLDLLP